MIRRWGVWLLAGWVAAGCGGAAPWAGPSLPPEALEAEYRVHAGDELDVTVWGQADLNRKVRVRGDGTFPFPFVGDIVAQQRTTQELEELLALGLSQGFLLDPQVTVRLISQRFAILGEIERSGTYPLEGRVDLLAAISMAGGVSKFGSSRVEIIRLLADGSKVSFHVDLNEILSGRRETVLIYPHDTIHVKRRLF